MALASIILVFLEMLPVESKMHTNTKFTSQQKQIVMWQEMEIFIEGNVLLSDLSILFISQRHFCCHRLDNNWHWSGYASSLALVRIC
jgi:hypothetical protein